MYPFTTLIAMALDVACGYPAWVFARIGHPVSWIGGLIAWCEARWNDPRLSFAHRRRNGVLALGVTLAATAAVTIAIVVALGLLLPRPWDIICTGVIASTLIAQRSLYEHVNAVANALQSGGLDGGRHAVAQIVGRRTDALDEAGVSRAAIESLAENYSDGVVAPLFWLLIGGLPGAALYKAINTGDSMVGHRSERYLAYGWASARLDDLVNLPASRLAAVFIILAAAVLPGCNARAAVRAVRRDARHHGSPNAGWPEAAFAGALGLRLAGPRIYGDETVTGHWMGDGRPEATSADIRRALRLYRTVCLLQFLTVAALALLLIT
ncbi:Adenosylcobinamide-phosphate synthase [Hyphomicrobium sulfonivorans]|uniref:Cobalamin biosynthesis protein CobD n=1 Tax=Hyphomicrobium sulfonivorans TaxID=121290 RepID=A0A109BAU4_HYPSL|nr:adenosylcobinamide-phosphate synthase CbiB [Hyphomicrobium sulfonivorans]KWT65244.1 Adenosylcobinamide-phosphate synthase [Hyphomicrobium sulfonivorans]